MSDADVVKENKQLRDKLQQMALDFMTSEGQWIERVGKLHEKLEICRARAALLLGQRDLARKELAEAEKDATRYRWLRSQWCKNGTLTIYPQLFEVEVDTAVDAEMAERTE